MKKSYVADTVLLGVTLIWGLMFIVVKNALDAMPAFAYLAVRFGLASVLLLAVRRLSPAASRGRFTRNTGIAGAILGIFLYGGFAGQTVGLTFTTASRAGFLTGFLVILVPIIARMFFGSRITLSMGIGIGIAFVGLGLLSVDKAEPFRWGDALILVGALAFAVHIVLTDRITARHDVYPLVTVQLAAVSALCLVSSFAAEDWRQAFRPEVLLTPRVALALLAGSLFATTFAYWAQTYFQRFTTPSHTALIFACEPIFAALGGFLVAGERMAAQAIVGAALIMIGIVVTEWRRSEEEPVPEKPAASLDPAAAPVASSLS
ncbi:DMT family transporter [Gorillibacterium sp. sgz500922]|uniref:DMT family transporter n=1 Tax=Gorillibacterium sp. sgz500922 TaxID=3446694 RepID=UPI003F669930